MSEAVVIIGEKINGAIPKTAKAIADRDESYIRELARLQTEAGADYLDCCASVEEGELEVLEWLIGLIQEESDLPICIDSPDPQACVDAMKFCKQPGIINSVAPEGDKCDIVFPAIADTEWKVIAMMNDEKGIPPTAEGRIEVAKKLVAEAEKYGIATDRIFVDCLVETLGTNSESMMIFTDSIKGIKELYPEIHFTSGLSNISFGLPSRKSINIPFMVLSMQAGMDSAIVDPLNQDMMGVIYGTSALLGDDEFCIEYITAYREEIFGQKK